jgi:hypothetical protein
VAVDREVQCVRDDPVDLEHGLGREALAASSAGGDQVGVKVLLRWVMYAIGAPSVVLVHEVSE